MSVPNRAPAVNAGILPFRAIRAFLAGERQKFMRSSDAKMPGVREHPGHFLTDLLLTEAGRYPPQVIAAAEQATKPLGPVVAGGEVGGEASPFPVGATPRVLE